MNFFAKRAQRGATLIEAMIGLVVLSIGLAGATRLQMWMRSSVESAQERGHAVRLAQATLERWRHGAQPSVAPDGFELELAAPAHAGTHAGTHAEMPQQTADAKVTWADRSGHTHSVRLSSASPAASSVYSAVLSLAPQDARLAARRQLPANARVLDDRRSLLRLSSKSATFWLVDNATGQVTARCATATARPLSSVTLEDLRSCTPAAGGLLSGFIRFSGKLLETNVELALDSQPTDPPLCEVDKAAAEGETFLSYACIVQQDAITGWSGRLNLAPVDWTLAASADAYKVCRYSNDWDNSGRIDHNAEHPAHYSDVRGPLRQQNYLVVRGDATCPAGQPPHNHASTVQHQP